MIPRKLVTEPTTLDAALDYAARGWHVFPLKPQSKEPATASMMRPPIRKNFAAGLRAAIPTTSESERALHQAFSSLMPMAKLALAACASSNANMSRFLKLRSPPPGRAGTFGSRPMHQFPAGSARLRPISIFAATAAMWWRRQASTRTDAGTTQSLPTGWCKSRARNRTAFPSGRLLLCGGRQDQVELTGGRRSTARPLLSPAPRSAAATMHSTARRSHRFNWSPAVNLMNARCSTV